MIVTSNDLILVTGATGFLGSNVLSRLLDHGFTNIRCLVRPTGDSRRLTRVTDRFPRVRVDVQYGNLLSRENCRSVVRGAAVILHVAAGIEKTFPGCFMNSAVTTRNLIDAVLEDRSIKRFVNVSSLAVYSNRRIARGRLLDETCDLETQFMGRFDPYCFGKTKQDEIVLEAGRRYNLPYVIVRPGPIYGPGARAPIHSRVGIGTFGVFLHLGGRNRIPLSYIDNCASAIVLAGITEGVDGEILNVIDDDLPTSATFLRRYKKEVAPFRSIYVPYRAFYLFCLLWERYAAWSKGQLPPAFNRAKCEAEWKRHRYSNQKLKDRLGWKPLVSTEEGLRRHFAYFRNLGHQHA
jgi:nucleoside-diphosphate-sugar epimerase